VDFRSGATLGCAAEAFISGMSAVTTQPLLKGFTRAPDACLAPLGTPVLEPAPNTFVHSLSLGRYGFRVVHNSDALNGADRVGQTRAKALFNSFSAKFHSKCLVAAAA
jgi:hypothetical protein